MSVTIEIASVWALLRTHLSPGIIVPSSLNFKYIVNFENLFVPTEGVAWESVVLKCLAKYTDDKYFSRLAF